jgi:hypothetical protein
MADEGIKGIPVSMNRHQTLSQGRGLKASCTWIFLAIQTLGIIFITN